MKFSWDKITYPRPVKPDLPLLGRASTTIAFDQSPDTVLIYTCNMEKIEYWKRVGLLRNSSEEVGSIVFTGWVNDYIWHRSSHQKRYEFGVYRAEVERVTFDFTKAHRKLYRETYHAIYDEERRPYDADEFRAWFWERTYNVLPDDHFMMAAVRTAHDFVYDDLCPDFMHWGHERSLHNLAVRDGELFVLDPFEHIEIIRAIHLQRNPRGGRL